MTDYKKRERRNYEALRALVAFICMIFIIAACIDIGYYNAKKYNLQKGLEVSALTGLQALPNAKLAKHLTLNVANSQGLALRPNEVIVDPQGQWIQIDKKAYYETMFLNKIGIKRLPIRAHVFDF